MFLVDGGDDTRVDGSPPVSRTVGGRGPTDSGSNGVEVVRDHPLRLCGPDGRSSSSWSIWEPVVHLRPSTTKVYEVSGGRYGVRRPTEPFLSGSSSRDRRIRCGSSTVRYWSETGYGVGPSYDGTTG